MTLKRKPKWENKWNIILGCIVGLVLLLHFLPIGLGFATEKLKLGDDTIENTGHSAAELEKEEESEDISDTGEIVIMKNILLDDENQKLDGLEGGEDGIEGEEGEEGIINNEEGIINNEDGEKGENLAEIQEEDISFSKGGKSTQAVDTQSQGEEDSISDDIEIDRETKVQENAEEITETKGGETKTELGDESNGEIDTKGKEDTGETETQGKTEGLDGKTDDPKAPSIAILLPGQDFNKVLFNLTRGDLSQIVTITGSVSVLRCRGFTTIISDQDSVEVYASFSNGVLTYCTTAPEIYLNADSEGMFAGLTNLTSIKLSDFNTSMVETMASMFESCLSLTSLDLSSFDTTNVTDMSYMFARCSSLTSLNLRSFDTSRVTDMSYMFARCSSLTSLDLSSFDTSGVADMSYMFDDCSSLTSLDLRSFDTTNVTDMSNMFARCSSLRSLDLSSFDILILKDANNMFNACSELETIYVNNFVATDIRGSDGMFYGAENLVGGFGTMYDPNYVDGKLALPDSQTRSGYFTKDNVLVSFRDSDDLELSSEVVEIGTRVGIPQMDTGYVATWYIDTGYTDLFDFTSRIMKYTKVYGVISCDTGYVEDTNGNCVRQVMVTFVANPTVHPGGHFSGGVTTKTLEYRQAPEGYYYAVTGEIQVPNLDAVGDTGYMFEGWYTNSALSSRWIGLTSGNTATGITLYAKYLPFKDKTVTRDGVTFTIMDRNLGATAASSGYTYNTSDSTTRGLYFQWGNNFGFANAGALSNTLASILISNYSNNPRGPGNYYFNGTYITRPSSSPYRYSGAKKNDNLWGGNSASNPDTARQGPCPDGYHVPYSTEWTATINLFDKWSATADGSTYCNSLTNSGSSFCLPAVLGLPYAGYRSYSSAGSLSSTYQGYQKTRAVYRAANANTSNANGAYRFYTTTGVLPGVAASSTLYYRAWAFPVRCFKNTENLTLTFDSKGGSSVANQTNFRRWQKRSAPSEPTRAHSTFVGRYKDRRFMEPVNWTNYYVSENTTLYAKWSCDTGYTDVGNACLDITAPTCTRGQPSKTSLKYGETGSITLTCTDTVGMTSSHLTGGDISLDNPYLTISSVSYMAGLEVVGAVTSITYTMVYEAVSDVQGEVVLTLPAGKVSDSAGNGNDAVSTTDYIFQSNGNITICDPNDSGNCITMQDRNLGAITNDITSTGSYGYHYQWGNNYGFEIGCRTNGCSGQITRVDGSVGDANSYGPNNPYSSGVFYDPTHAIGSYYNWAYPANLNLWGGSGDASDNGYGYPLTNATERQGPCDTGYHVPSAGEMNQLMGYWADNYTGGGSGNLVMWDEDGAYMIDEEIAVAQFRQDFKMPFAGERGSAAILSHLGDLVGWWTSSATNNHYGYFFQLHDDDLYTTESPLYIAHSVRCFKDTPTTGFTKNSTIVVDSIVPDMVFTGSTPAHDTIQGENYFASQIEITESNLSGFKSSFDGVQTSLYDDSLLLMYNFDNVQSLGEGTTLVKDWSRYGNDGTISSSSTVTTTGGKWGGAYNFAGGNINVGNDESLSVTRNFTVSTWIKTNMSASDGNKYYMSRWDSGVDKRVRGLILPANKNTAGVIFSTDGSNATYIYGTKVINDGSWHLITLTHNGSQIKLYVDGDLDGSKNNTSLYSTDANFIISNTSSFRGQLDEVRMYNRALSATEIQELYRGNLSKTDVDKWTYTVEYTGLAAGTYSYGGSASDMMGNESTIIRTINIDTSAPTVTLSSRLSGLACELPGYIYTVTGQFSETVTGVDKSTLTITNGTVQSFNMVSGDTAVWTVTINPHNATESVYHFDNDISYTLNSGTAGQKTFTGVGTITVSDGVDMITLLDRNLGAMESGTGCTNSNTGTCGYHFQWGNNYGFSPDVTPVTGSTKVPSSSVNSGYMSQVFTVGNNNWADGDIGNIRGGSTDDIISTLSGDNWKVTNATNRQGPCPDGFHVPSYGEIMKINAILSQNYNSGEFENELLISKDGYRKHGDSNLTSRGSNVYMRTSTPNSAISIKAFKPNLQIQSDNSARGQSIRCIYNQYEMYDPSAIASGDLGSIMIQTGSFTDLYGNTNTDASNIISREYDTQAPATPSMVAEPTYTQGTTNTVSTTGVLDIAGLGNCLSTLTLQYQFCRSTANNTDNCTFSVWSTSKTASFNGLSDGTKYYYFVRARDAYGNISDWSSSTYSTQDDTAPSITFSPNGGAQQSFGNVIVTVSDTVSGLSGNQTIQYMRSTDGRCSDIWDSIPLSPSTAGSTTATASISAPQGEGDHYLCINSTVSDQVGNKNKSTTTIFTIDTTAPKPEITTTYNPKATTQTASLDCSGAVNGDSYYRGTGNNPSPRSYKEIPFTIGGIGPKGKEGEFTFEETQSIPNQTIDSPGTYYLFCKDAVGNISSGSITYHSYRVINMEETVDGNTSSYNINSYSEASSEGPYLYPGGEVLSLPRIYTNPSSGCDSFAGMSIGEPSNSIATLTGTDPILDHDDTTYTMWFTRNTYDLILQAGTGIFALAGRGTYKRGEPINISAVVNPGYSWSTWTKTVGTNPSTFTAGTQSQTINLACGDATLRADATANTYTITYNTSKQYLYDPFGNHPNTNAFSYTIEDDLTLYTNGKTGLVFNGWDVDSSNSGGSWSSINSTITNMHMGTGNYGDVSLNYNFGCDSGYVKIGDDCMPEFEDIDAYFIKTGGVVSNITLMDRNLGATQAGTGCSDVNTGVCGYHYQWGNNHGFQICYTDSCTDLPGGETMAANSRISTLGYGPGNYYTDNLLRIITDGGDQDWSNPSNDNLWGGSGSETDRQGPCPDGFHIPTLSEWSSLMQYWVENRVSLGDNLIFTGTAPFYGFTGQTYSFADDFKFPFGGNRGYSNGKMYNIGVQDSFWVSTPVSSGTEAYRVRINSNLDNSVVTSFYRSYPLSLRCFKDTSVSGSSIAVDSNGGENAMILVNGDTISTLESPSREHSVFEGWYSTSAFTAGSEISTGDTAPAALYAKWSCEPGFTLVGDACLDITAPSVVISSNGSGTCSTGNTYTVTGSFSEAVTGIDASTLTVNGGTVQNFTMVSGDTAVWTVSAGGNGGGSDYMHYQDGTISICDPDSNGTKCITMQDKNLGASEAGTGTSSYGNHYQRGNNHEFAIGCYENGCSDTVTSSAVTTKAPWDNSYNNYGYNGGITNFMKGSNDYRENNSHYNGLWGGANDSQANNRGYDEENNVATNVTGRQGPCGEGYHVPSQGERGTLLKYWAANYTGKTQNSLTLEGTAPLYNFSSNSTAASQFQEDFKIPFAGYRDRNAKVYEIGGRANLWSSSPIAGDEYARAFYLHPNGAYAIDSDGRAHAFSVRCFKNSYLSFPSSEGGENTVTVYIETGAFTDLAGNVNTGSSNTITWDYDQAGPTGTIDVKFQGGDKYATGTTFSLTLSASDEGCNGGVSGVQFSCDGINWSPAESFATTKTFSLADYTSAGCTTGDGQKTIYARFVDGFGNPGEAVSDSIKLNRLGIVLQATATAANQTLKINKYFANAYTVDRGDGTTGDLIDDTQHNYAVAGTYTITLSLSGASRWTFQDVYTQLVPTAGTSMTGVKVTYMPSLAEGFGNSATAPGDNFFYTFNDRGAITSLPAGSFDTSNITVVGDKFFMGFNEMGSLVSLPVGSFNTEHITTVGDYFFSHFNNIGALTSLPDDSFDTSNIVTIGNHFFSTFNQEGALISLPTGSFDISSISGTVGNQFFNWFNNGGALTSLPAGSFDTSNITAVGDEFFSYFNQSGVLTNLPDDSFNISNITTVGNEFFFCFNHEGALTSLPDDSFNTSNISGAVGYYFFDSFNFNGALTSLPAGSFNLSNITSAESGFFYAFNTIGKITSLPTGSFNTSNLTSVGNQSFAYFNYQGEITSLPEGSFNLSNIISVGEEFFYAFNCEGKLTNLPESFTINSVGASVTGGYEYAFYSPNYTINRGVYGLVSGVIAPLDDRDTFSDNQPKRCGVDPNWLDTTSNACSITYDSNGGSTIANPTQLYTADTTGVVAGSGITIPTRANSQFVGWYTGIQTGSQVTTVLFPAMDSGTLYAFWSCDTGYKISGDACILNKDIVLQATATAANQTLKINKYFANDYTVDRGDGITGALASDTTHTYNNPGTYTITLLLPGANRWTFYSNNNKPLVPKSGTTMTGVQITYMPSLAEGFGISATSVDNYFFARFNNNGALISLPVGSFDTSSITSVGNNFFNGFNQNGALTTLPDGSFDTSNITSVGNNFFVGFNRNGALTTLPDGSFRLSTGLMTVGNSFFYRFNIEGALTSLPDGSFDTSNITTVGNSFFEDFNNSGSLTSLPEGSFRLSTGLTTVGNYFFQRFNQYGALTSLPDGSFNTSNITSVGDDFFDSFNNCGFLTSLPAGSFNTSNITTASDYFFRAFNTNGSLTHLPDGSFDTSKITTAGTYFFYFFNYSGSLTNLPDSFKLTSAAYNKTNGYTNAFNSSNYTLNKNVSDLVSGVTIPLDDRNTFSDNQPGRCGVDPNWLVTTTDACSITYNSNGGSTIANPTQLYTADTTGVVAGSGVTTPTRANSQFVGWYTGIQSGSQVTTVLFPAMDSGTLYAFWSCDTGYKISGDACVLNKDIVLQATATSANQTLTINKYFANAYTVDRGDGTTGNLTADTTHTYNNSGTYIITLSPSGANRWTFTSITKPLVPKEGTTATGVQIVYMPSLAEGFGNSATSPGDFFFKDFNRGGALIRLPEGSFNTENIIGVGKYFFTQFNYNGGLESLPEGSFDISNITTVGNYFFANFNNNGSLTSLPNNSFDTSNITIVGSYFFSNFNCNGSLTSLPVGSFDTSNIITVGNYFFYRFNRGGNLTSLPSGSFRFSTGLTTVGDYFFDGFNEIGNLTGLSSGSFDMRNITRVGDNFFYAFNYEGNLKNLPDGSFNISSISGAVGDYFFGAFNTIGALEELPAGSFDISNITFVGDYFFAWFNAAGLLTELPVNSFRLSTGLTIVGTNFFASFNYSGSLTKLPDGSFDTSNITTIGDEFFYIFNYNGKIVQLPNSFTMNSTGATVTGGYRNAFNSPNYTLNKNVSDLVSGLTAPLDDRDTFSDNQPKRCGVHPNWLYTTADACSITYDSNGGSTIANPTQLYTADTTGVVAGSGVTTPTRVDYEFVGRYTGIQSGSLITTVLFPEMDSGTLYAHWRETVPPTVVISSDGAGMCAGSGDVYTVTGSFSEAVTGIDASTLTVINGTVQDFNMISDTEAVWTVTKFDLSDYIRETNISGVNTLTICDPNNSGACITMMDRNLGAENNDITSTGSYGYYYQWGNNHGFESCYVNGCNTFPGGETTGGQIDCGGYSPSTPLDDNVFRVGYADYCTLRNNNLRGGSGDSQSNNRGYDEENNVATNVENREGPCGEGYHVPSAGEWSKLLEYWAANYTGAGETLTLNYFNGLSRFTNDSIARAKFHEDFKIPSVGNRDYSTVHVYGIGNYTLLLSSSPNLNNAHILFSDLNEVRSSNTSARAYGYSVRCFKNEPVVPTSSTGYGTVTVIIETGAVVDLAGNANTEASNTISREYDDAGPEFTLDDVEVPECTDGTLVITGITQIGCGEPYQSRTPYVRNGEGSYFLEYTSWSGGIGSEIVTAGINDSLGNYTYKTATITWTDTAPTANDFTVDEVGAYSEANWIEESEATDGDCGADTLEGEVIVDGIQGYCEIDEEDPAWLMYYPDDGASGSDSCTIMITDDEGSTGTFTVTWNDIYRPNPQVLFVSPTPASGSVLTTNKFTLKAEISDVENIDSLVYNVYNFETDKEESYSITPGNHYIFNFDNVADLGEVENESVVSAGIYAEGTVYGATRVSSGRYGGAYSFDGVDDYIDLGILGMYKAYSIVLWAKPDGEEWTHFVYAYDPRGGSYYINGIYYGSVMPLELNGVFASDSIIGKNKAALRPTYFAGLIDEVRVYPRAISANEAQYLYNSNLRKTGIDTWEFETINSCLDMSGMYEYTVGVTSDIDTYGEDARTISTQISVSPNDFSVDGVGLGTDVNWVEEAGVSEFVCGDYTLEGEVIVDGTQGECVIDGDYLEYYPDDGASGSDTCTILVTHSDGNTGQFTVTWNDIYRPNPQVTFVSPTPADGVVRNRNRFTTKAEISDVEYIDNLYYGIYDIDDDFWSENSISRMMIYNFDNVSDLGEIENESVMSTNGDEWLVDGATRVNSGRYGGAYSFDGIDDSFETLRIYNFIIGDLPYSLALWAKPEGGEWTHIVYSYNPEDGEKYYVNGREDSLPGELSNLFNIFETISGKRKNINLDLGHNDDQYFTGLIDEVIVFDYTLYEEDVQFLYKSNLRKTGLDTWEFETITPCLDMSGSYEYYVGLDSNIGTYGEDYRTLTTQIPITVNGTGYDFGTHVTTGLDLILTGTMGTLAVTDYVGQPGWRLYFTTSPYLIGQNTQQTISTENLKFKASGLAYSGLYDLTNTNYVYLSDGISDEEYTSAAGMNSGDTILEYFVRDENDGSDWMCEDVGTYSDESNIMLEVPAWQVADTYTGTLWITLQIDSDEKENEGGGKDAEETKDTDLGDHKEQEKQEPSTPELTGEIIKTGGENRK